MFYYGGNLMVFCPNCGKENENGSKFCYKCGKSLNFKIIDEEPTFKNQSEKLSKLDEEIKIKEIKRLISLHDKKFVTATQREPKVGLFTDDEILKYAPKSQAAIKIRTKRANGIIEKIKVNPFYQQIIYLIIIFSILALIIILI